jgi:hypothetical protein
LATIEEIEIEREQVNTFKVDYHKEYLHNWINKNKIKMDFDRIREIRAMHQETERIIPAHKSTYKKLAVQCSTETLVVNQNLALLMNFVVIIANFL